VGEYHWGERINDWIENYPNGKRKKLLPIPKHHFEKDSRPFVRKEWDEEREGDLLEV
jgi:hypothetical protein